MPEQIFEDIEQAPALRYENCWEADLYSVDGRRVDRLRWVAIDGRAYAVQERTVSVPYDDMGHPSFSTSKHFFVREKVFGIPMEFDLNTIAGKTVVKAVVFELQP